MSRVGVHIRRGAEGVAGVPWTASGPVPAHRSRRAKTFLSLCRRRWRRRRRGFGTHSGHGHAQMAPSSEVVGGPGQRRGRAWVGRQRRTRPGPAGDEVLLRQWPSLKSGRGRQWLFCHSRWRGARDLLPLLFPTQTPAFRSPGRYLPAPSNPPDRPWTACYIALLEAMLPWAAPHLQMPIVAFANGYDEPSPGRPGAVPSPVPFRPIFPPDRRTALSP